MSGGAASRRKSKPAPLGTGQFFRKSERPLGAKGTAIDLELDYEILQHAKKNARDKRITLGAALRVPVNEHMAEGRLPKRNTESHIQRLRRLRSAKA